MSNLNLETRTREQIAAFLPDALARALTSYFEFSQSSANEKACKDFAARHAAAKAALAHIELLIKLARLAGLPDAQAENHNQQILLAAMLQEAEEELKVHQEKEKS